MVDAVAAGQPEVLEGLPDARIAWFDRQYHHATVLSPRMVAEDLLTFLHAQAVALPTMHGAARR